MGSIHPIFQSLDNEVNSESRSKTVKVEQMLREYQLKKDVKNHVKPYELFMYRGAVHWSKMSGKMYGKRAIGRPMTSRCQDNKKIDGSICQKCYASTINTYYSCVNAALQRNRDLEPGDIFDDPPIFTDIDLTWRSNWNGDYQDENDVLVDFAICDVVNYATCTAWTKNFDIVERLDSVRPSNYTLMQSSLMINQITEDESPAANQIFTVFTPEFAIENDIHINCNGACRLCGKCYGNDLKKRPRFVNELIKGGEIKYFKLMGVL